MQSSRFLSLIVFIGAFWFLPAASAQDSWQAIAHRLEDDIRVDGVLDEDVWREAPPIGEFTQVEPRTGEPPTERTEIRFAYSQNALYIGVRCLDSQVDKILATEMGRDGRLFTNDNVELVIDTFHDRRNAYYFQTNPIGAMVDGRINENSFPDLNWDGIWLVRTHILDDAWTAEFEIPFKTLGFEPGNDTWGFNAERLLAREREISRWASPSLDVRLNQVNMAGELDGLHGLSQGVGLDIKPYGLIGYSRDVERDDLHQFPHDAGLDVFYRITSNLVSSTTINTDFAETEVDARIVNLTRFSVSFPEKRTFFLEDAGIFEFGGGPGGGGSRGGRGGRGGGSLGGGGGGAGGAGGGPGLIPFFSRTIGLVDGEPVPILVGEKLTGKVGRFDVGILDVVTGEKTFLPDQEAGETEPRLLQRQNLFVARAKMNFWNQSYVGALFTNGQPTGETTNRYLGADFKLATSDFLQSGKNFDVNGFVSKTQTPDLVDKDGAYGFGVNYPNDLINARYMWEHIGENFNPALGYVRRYGVELNSVRFGVNPRPERWNIRQARFMISLTQYENLAQQQVETRSIFLTPLNLEFNSGAILSYRINPTLERLFEPFEIRDGISIPAGKYSTADHTFSYYSSSTRNWGYSASWATGSFYDGTSNQLITTANWGNSHISTEFTLQQYWVRLPHGDFDTKLAVTRFDYSFSPLITLATFVQYDTDTQNIGLQSRLRWILKPGNEIYFVVNHAWERNPLDRFDAVNTDVRAKLNYTFRF